MTQQQSNVEQQEAIEMGWHPYDLDHAAQELVLRFRNEKNVLNESHKMRMAVAYGLERFWGERFRFQRENNPESRNKGDYWKSVWVEVAKILSKGHILLPDEDGTITFQDTNKIKETAAAIWQLEEGDRYVALMVLTQFCNALVWWTQRYKTKKDED